MIKQDGVPIALIGRREIIHLHRYLFCFHPTMSNRYLWTKSIHISVPFLFRTRFFSTIELTRNATSTKVIQWHDLLEWLANGQKTSLWRDENCAQQYIEHQKSVDENYRSINDYIRINYLKWNSAIDPSSQKRIAVPSPTSIQGPLLTPNRFPYHLAQGIEHWLIWCDPKPSEPEKIVQQVIDREFPSKRFERISFINPPRLRSISDVFHAHVFTREIQR